MWDVGEDDVGVGLNYLVVGNVEVVDGPIRPFGIYIDCECIWSFC